MACCRAPPPWFACLPRHRQCRGFLVLAQARIVLLSDSNLVMGSASGPMLLRTENDKITQERAPFLSAKSWQRRFAIFDVVRRNCRAARRHRFSSLGLLLPFSHSLSPPHTHTLILPSLSTPLLAATQPRPPSTSASTSPRSRSSAPSPRASPRCSRPWSAGTFCRAAPGSARGGRCCCSW